MKKMIYRILAFALDMTFVSLLTLGLTYIPFINPNSDEYRKQYDVLTIYKLISSLSILFLNKLI